MKKYFRKTAIVLAAVFALSSVVPGCSGKNNGNTNTTAGDTKSSYTIDMYFMTWGGKSDDIDQVQAAMNKITTSKINAKLVLHCIDGGAWPTQIPLLYSSGQKIDFVLTSANMSPNYSTMVSSGQLVALDPLINQYGQGIQKALTKEFLYGAKIGGKIYALPVNKEKASAYGGFSFNKKLVDQFGVADQVKAIKSYTDLEPIFKTVHAKDPSVTCMTMQGGDDTSYCRDQYVDYYGTNLGGVMPINTKDYKLVNLYTYQPYVDAIRWTHQMYKDGYINPAVTTNNDNSMKDGKAFCWPDKTKQGIDKEESLSYGYEVMTVDVNKPYEQADQAQGIMEGIGSTAKNPARDMMFMNLLFTNSDLLNTLIYGIEGKDYVKTTSHTDAAGNKVTIIDYPSGVTSQSVSWSNQGWAYGNEFLDYLFSSEDPEKWANYAKTNETLTPSSTFGFAFDQSKVTTEISACSTVMKNYAVLETGALDPDTALPQLVNQLNAAGYETIAKEKQSQIDAWVKANKK